MEYRHINTPDQYALWPRILGEAIMIRMINPLLRELWAASGVGIFMLQ